MTTPRVSVRLTPEFADDCERLSSKLEAPLLQTGVAATTPYLVDVHETGVSLTRLADTGMRPLVIDLGQVRRLHRKDPLRKAIGLEAKTVVDATAGWCTDASALAAAGLRVVAIEQDELIAVLAGIALNRCGNEQVRANLEIRHGSSERLLPALEPVPDVVYLDPMFAPRTKSAAVKKPLALLQELVAPSGNADTLLQAALAAARLRVAVKRQLHAVPLAPGRVGAVYAKMIRFDLYHPHSNAS